MQISPMITAIAIVAAIVPAGSVTKERHIIDSVPESLLSVQYKEFAKEETSLQPVETVKVEQPVIETVVAQKPVQSVPTGQCGDNQYANYIYMHESSCNPAAVNQIGCRGIGQACPGDKLPCGADYACQNAYFTKYALERYGSWEAAYHFWVQNSWW